MPGGNALVASGGSGKQSLARLASCINGQDVASVLVTSSYGLNELRGEVQNAYNKSGLRNLPMSFVLMVSQIVVPESRVDPTGLKHK